MSSMPEEEEIKSRDRDFSREDQENVNRTIKALEPVLSWMR